MDVTFQYVETCVLVITMLINDVLFSVEERTTTRLQRNIPYRSHSNRDKLCEYEGDKNK